MPTVGPLSVTQDHYEIWPTDFSSLSAFNEGANELYVGKLASYYFTGLYWASVAVPQGATITSATIAITASANYGGPPPTDVYGHNVNTSFVFTGITNSNLHDMALTTATVAKTFTSGSSNSITVTTIVQEIVNRIGWSSGANLRIGIYGNATSGQTTLTASEAGTAPTLTIVYGGGGGGVPIPVILAPDLRAPMGGGFPNG